MKTILVPVDFSESTAGILQVAADLARLTGSRLHLLHVAEPLAEVVAFDPGVGGTVACHAPPEVEGIREQLAALARPLAGSGLVVECDVVTGPLDDRILEAADKHSAAWIVMGSHGHGALYHLLVGSGTEAVLRRALCPVVVVPSRIQPHQA